MQTSVLNQRSNALKFLGVLLSLSLFCSTANAQLEIETEQNALIYRGELATIVFSTSGGGLIDFRLNSSSINPLNWDSAGDGNDNQKPRPRGHFLCLDRWGAASESEQAQGVPFHGEASLVQWTASVLDDPDAPRDGMEMRISTGKMACVLPIAGLRVERTIRFQSDSAACVVTEEVTNEGRLGRVYNMVQHPSIAPPFLENETIVDSNASYGFSQADPIPKSASEADQWPKMKFAEQEVDLRSFRNSGKDGSDVSSFVFAKDVRFGWVTACNVENGLLLGYLWKTSDYPWLNIWRHRQNGKVVARGLEFGTTGYHQPFAVLIKQHQILERSLFEYIDANESQTRSYVAFVASLPSEFAGVKSVNYSAQQIQITERAASNPRVVSISLAIAPW